MNVSSSISSFSRSHSFFLRSVFPSFSFLRRPLWTACSIAPTLSPPTSAIWSAGLTSELTLLTNPAIPKNPSRTSSSPSINRWVWCPSVSCLVVSIFAGSDIFALCCPCCCLTWASTRSSHSWRIPSLSITFPRQRHPAIFHLKDFNVGAKRWREADNFCFVMSTIECRLRLLRRIRNSFVKAKRDWLLCEGFPPPLLLFAIQMRWLESCHLFLNVLGSDRSLAGSDAWFSACHVMRELSFTSELGA